MRRFATAFQRVKFPHPLALLLAGVLVATILTWVLPAGEYERRTDPVTGREVAVAGSYHAVEASPVGLFGALVAVPHGMTDAAAVIFFIFLVGGAFAVVERTGALQAGVGALVSRVGDRPRIMIPVVCLAFAVGGALNNTQEEIIAVMPALLLLATRLGYSPVTAAAMSLGSAGVASAFSPINPFQVGLAQKVAEVPLLSGAGFRTAFLVVAMAVWIGWTLRYAAAERGRADLAAADAGPGLGSRDLLVLTLFGSTFGVFVYGVLGLGWDFDRMTALFFGMGILAGLVGGLGVGGTAEAFLGGFRSMAPAAMMVGMARTIYVVLADGRVIDSVVHGLFTPIAELPLMISALGMLVAHSIVHVPVSSVSGHAVLTMPVVAPLSDLLGLSRQVAILAYQYGAGLTDLVTPTNGSMMAVIAAAGVSYDDWLRMVLVPFVALMVLGAVSIVVAILLGLS